MSKKKQGSGEEKIRKVSDLAREVKLSPRAVMDMLKGMGYSVRSAQSAVTEEMIREVKEKLQTLKQEDRIHTRKDLTDFDKQWFEDALLAINSLPAYGPPLFVKLDQFKQIQASGLQVTKSPGKDIVYLGSLMLTLGVFLMFYMRYQRVWVLIQPAQKRLIVAAKDGKNTPGMRRLFKQLRAQLSTHCESG